MSAAPIAAPKEAGMLLDADAKKKPRETGVEDLVDALEDQQGDPAYLAMPFGERLAMTTDAARSLFVDAKAKGLANRTHLRFPSADVRKAGVVEERHIDRHLLSELAAGAFVQHRANVVFHGMAGSGKSCLMCALAKESCHRQRRCLYMRIPDLATEREGAESKYEGETKLLAKLANYDVLRLDEWLLDPPEPEFRSFLFELIERRYDAAPTLLCTQHPKKDWHQRLGGGVHADAIMGWSTERRASIPETSTYASCLLKRNRDTQTAKPVVFTPRSNHPIWNVAKHRIR